MGCTHEQVILLECLSVTLFIEVLAYAHPFDICPTFQSEEIRSKEVEAEDIKDHAVHAWVESRSCQLCLVGSSRQVQGLAACRREMTEGLKQALSSIAVVSPWPYASPPPASVLLPRFQCLNLLRLMFPVLLFLSTSLMTSGESHLQIPHLTEQSQGPIPSPLERTPISRYRESHLRLVQRDLLPTKESEKVWVCRWVQNDLCRISARSRICKCVRSV